MTKQEYIHIRNLSLDILIDAKINSLPVDVTKIENVYHLPRCHFCANRYEHMLIVSDQILELYGLNKTGNHSKYLAIRILAPMVVLDKIGVNSPEEIMYYTDLPKDIAIQRFNRLATLRIKYKNLCASHMEARVLDLFSMWIEQQ